MDDDALIVGAVCARGGSKGVPRKNLRLLLGKPLMAHTIECARACSMLHRVVVSTDDAEMAEVGRRYGAEIPFMRPTHLAQDYSSKWDVFRHLVSSLEEIDGKRVDILVDLDTGVPLRSSQDIADCVDLLLSGTSDVVTTAYEAERNPYFNMAEIGEDGFAHIVISSKKHIAYRQAAPQVYSLSPAVFAIRRDALWNYDHWSQSKLQLSIIPRERAIDIDEEVDFEMVEFLMKQKEIASE